MAKKKKRVELRKNRTKPPRDNDWTRGFGQAGSAQDDAPGQERVRAKGDLSRKRTIMTDASGQQAGDSGDFVMPHVDPATHLPGRVLRVHGLDSIVRTDDGRQLRCKIRRLLKSLATDERNIVT